MTLQTLKCNKNQENSCMVLWLTGSSGSSCTSSISAVERPDMSAHTAYSLQLQGASGPCVAHNTRDQNEWLRSSGGVRPYVVPWCTTLSSPRPINTHLCIFTLSRGAIGGRWEGEVEHGGLISCTRPAGEARVASPPPNACVYLGLRKRATLSASTLRRTKTLSGSFRCKLSNQ